MAEPEPDPEPEPEPEPVKQPEPEPQPPKEPPPPGEPLLPDLLTVPPSEIFIEVWDNGQHMLRFTQGFANIGDGPVQVRGMETHETEHQGYQEILDVNGEVVESVPAGSVIFHPHHEHWHADKIANYDLRRGSPDGEIVVRNAKISYCFVDDRPFPDWTGPRSWPKYLDCTQVFMGLSVGYIDVYTADLYDQWIDITGVPDGDYFLVIEADPDHMYKEITRDNNIAWVHLEIYDGGTQVRILESYEPAWR